MKVLHIETGRHLYGGALQVKYLLEGLQQKGVENLLVCPRGSAIGKACREFAQVYEVPLAGDLDLRFLWHLRRILRREHPDWVHVHSRRGADLWGGLAARMAGIPALITRRVDNPEPRWLVKWKYGLYERVVTISEGIRQVLLKEGVPPEKMGLIPSAVDTRVYKPECDKDWFRAEFGLAPEEKAVAVVAQLIPRKGHRFLIEAAPAILKECPQTRFLFFGQGSLREELEELCTARGIGDKVIFAGFRDDLHRVLPCLDLVVHPALMEGLGVSLLQASACGVPIVASRAGGIPEVVRDGENGALISPGRSDEIAFWVRKFLSDCKMRCRAADAGRRLIRSCFAVSTMVAAYMKMYTGAELKGDAGTD